MGREVLPFCTGCSHSIFSAHTHTIYFHEANVKNKMKFLKKPYSSLFRNDLTSSTTNSYTIHLMEVQFHNAIKWIQLFKNKHYHYLWGLDLVETFFLIEVSPVSWSYRVHWLHLCRGVRPPLLTSILDILSNVMVRLQ